MKSKLFYLICALWTLASATQFLACSGKKIDESNPQELFKDAEEDVQSKRYVMALDKFKSLKNKFPYEVTNSCYCLILIKFSFLSFCRSVL